MKACLPLPQVYYQFELLPHHPHVRFINVWDLSPLWLMPAQPPATATASSARGRALATPRLIVSKQIPSPYGRSTSVYPIDIYSSCCDFHPVSGALPKVGWRHELRHCTLVMGCGSGWQLLQPLLLRLM